jgi:hypothetical protein
VSLAKARAAGLKVEGKREWVRAFPSWFLRYAFAHVSPARVSPPARADGARPQPR